MLLMVVSPLTQSPNPYIATWASSGVRTTVSVMIINHHRDALLTASLNVSNHIGPVRTVQIIAEPIQPGRSQMIMISDNTITPKRIHHKGSS